jgi:putative transcriptional regulator
MTEKQLLARDAKRDIGAELLLSVRQMRAGKGKVIASVQQQPKVLKQVFKNLASV